MRRYSWVHAASTLITAVLPGSVSPSASVSGHVQQGARRSLFSSPFPGSALTPVRRGLTQKWDVASLAAWDKRVTAAQRLKVAPLPVPPLADSLNANVLSRHRL